MDDVHIVKKRNVYGQWTQEESKALLKIMKFNFGFGYDSTSKKFTAPKEIWDDYLKACLKDKNLRDGVSDDDYEDLQIVVGGGVIFGKSSIGLGNATGARTLQASEVQDMCIDDLSYDLEEFEQFNSPLTGSREVFELPKKNLLTKRSKSEYEGSSNSSSNYLESDI
ncbi:uncharacterized protein At2g29880-like [Daucus carota subsp. sativus]|uniref:uncharacterized protein At2g29880-like n=1 Tax=Daucus carota subsp. sativus TaxID=79200 RepID=UPI003083E4AF